LISRSKRAGNRGAVSDRHRAWRARNGSSGVNDVATGLVAQGLSIYDTLRSSIADESASIARAGSDENGTPVEK
jgi:hypothetical protein